MNCPYVQMHRCPNFSGVLTNTTGFDSWDPELNYQSSHNLEIDIGIGVGIDIGDGYQQQDFSSTLPTKLRSKSSNGYNWGFASLDRNGKCSG